MKDKAGLKNLTLDELQTELLVLRKEQFTMRVKKANGLLDKKHDVKNVRRNIARVKTYMSEKAGKDHD